MAAFSDGFVIIQMSSLGKGGWGCGGGAGGAPVLLARQRRQLLS